VLQKIHQDIKTFFFTKTFLQTSLVSSSTIINGILGALFYILAADNLGIENFGILTVAIATLTLIADVADLGTNTGLVKFVSEHLQSNKITAFKYLKLSLEVKVIVWIIVLVLGFLLVKPLSFFVFQKPELELPLKLVVFGVGGALLFSFATSSLQAFQKYKEWSAINIISNGLRLLLLVILALFQMLNLNNTLSIYILLPFFSFFLASLLLPTRQYLASKNEFEVAPSFFHYNKWVALMGLIAAFSARLDTFLNTRLLTLGEVGIYGLANQLTTLVPQLVGALGVVAAPKFASFTNKNDMILYFKKFQLMVLGLAAVGLLAIPFAFIIVSSILPQYIPSLPIFNILLIAMLVFLISVPVHQSIFYYFGKPKIFVWISLGHLLIISVLGYFMIVNFRLYGAAVTVFLGQLFDLIVPLIWFLKKIKE
jgi:O-antigen/teichoic acid export membrane protein